MVQLQNSTNSACMKPTCTFKMTLSYHLWHICNRSKGLSRLRLITCATNFFKFAYTFPYRFYKMQTLSQLMISAVDTKCLCGHLSIQVLKLYNFAMLFYCKRHIFQVKMQESKTRHSNYSDFSFIQTNNVSHDSVLH